MAKMAPTQRFISSKDATRTSEEHKKKKEEHKKKKARTIQEADTTVRS